MQVTDLNYQYYLQLKSEDTDKYAGKWIAIVDQHIVASSKRAGNVIEKVVHEYPKKEHFLTRIPAKGIIELL